MKAHAGRLKVKAGGISIALLIQSLDLSAQLIDRNPSICEICVIRDSELVRHKHQIKHIDNPIAIHIRLGLIRAEALGN